MNKKQEITQEKAYEGYKEILKDSDLLEKEQKAFEKAFGKDQNRSQKQWSNLVRVYGIETICLHESMTEEEVQFNCLTLSQRLNNVSKRINKINRLRNTIK